MNVSAAPTPMPVRRRSSAVRAAKQARPVTAPGVPMAAGRHNQTSQDAAAMTAGRGGSAERYKREPIVRRPNRS
jgi:hypothetical protein